MRVQSFSASSQVKPGHKASFVIWVWSTKADSTDVSVTAKVARALYVESPVFTVCPDTHGTTCKVGNLPAGQADELQATVRVRAKAALGEQVQVSAKATGKGARSFNDSATDVVVVPPTTGAGSAGGGGTGTTLPVPSTLPTISGAGGVSPTDPSGLFPTVKSATPTPGTGSLGLPKAKAHPTLHASDAASTVPLDDRLIGGQLAGLAVLAGAITIAIARLSLRSPKPAEEAKSSAPAKDTPTKD